MHPNPIKPWTPFVKFQRGSRGLIPVKTDSYKEVQSNLVPRIYMNPGLKGTWFFCYSIKQNWVHLKFFFHKNIKIKLPATFIVCPNLCLITKIGLNVARCRVQRLVLTSYSNKLLLMTDNLALFCHQIKWMCCSHQLAY